jgi:hypothetical protein
VIFKWYIKGECDDIDAPEINKVMEYIGWGNSRDTN